VNRAESKGGHSLAYQFVDRRTGGRLLVAPDVAQITPSLSEAVSTSEAVLFDGTFWSSDELSKVRPNAKLAADMGHVTIRDCSLELLKKSTSSNKVYIHINNTNPILAPHSPERMAVEAAGIAVGWDGLEFEL
jgi:pyrroloquinoline quinone biosynthesis protein B